MNNINIFLLLNKLLKMVETEMSLKSDLVNKKKILPEYSKLEVKEEISNNNNTKKLYKLEKIPYVVNSDQIRPITHKYFYSKLGNTYTFYADDSGNPKIIIGPHWPLFVSVEIFFSIFFFAILIYFRQFISLPICLLGLTSYFLFFFSYAITALLNPGYPKLDEETLYNKNKKKTGYCNVCKIWLDLDKKIKHCKFCNICIEGMDHHCPWTGKCIGKRNVIPFYIFVFSVFGLFSFCIYIIVTCQDKLYNIQGNK